MIYAQIKDGVIKNTIKVDENTDLSLFLEGFDHLIRIDNLDTIPGIRWSYDGASFAPPIELVEIVEGDQ